MFVSGYPKEALTDSGENVILRSGKLVLVAVGGYPLWPATVNNFLASFVTGKGRDMDDSEKVARVLIAFLGGHSDETAHVTNNRVFEFKKETAERFPFSDHHPLKENLKAAYAEASAILKEYVIEMDMPMINATEGVYCENHFMPIIAAHLVGEEGPTTAECAVENGLFDL